MPKVYGSSSQSLVYTFLVNRALIEKTIVVATDMYISMIYARMLFIYNFETAVKYIFCNVSIVVDS